MTDTLLIITGSAIRIATPIMFAALGETVSEKGGVLNLGIEGTILASTFTAFIVTDYTNSLTRGLLAAVLISVFIGMIFGILVVYLRLNQYIVGLGTTLLASSLSLYFYRLQYGGHVSQVKLEHFFEKLNIIEIAFLKPILNQYLLTYVVFLCFFCVGLIINRTQFGLQLRAVGENPEAADIAGINVNKVRYGGIIFGSIFVGLSGAFLSLAQSKGFSHGIVNGQGWIAIAMVVFGNWQVSRVLIGSLLFSIVQATQLHFQAIDANVSHEFLLATPYIFMLLILMVSKKKIHPPSSLTQSYEREN